MWDQAGLRQPIICERYVNLSITHKLSPYFEPDLDVSQPGHSAPPDGVAGRRILGAGEIAEESSDLREIVRELSFGALLLRVVWH